MRENVTIMTNTAFKSEDVEDYVDYTYKQNIFLYGLLFGLILLLYSIV